VASVGATALEGFEHQISHGPDVCLNAFEPIGIVVAILGPLAIGAVALVSRPEQAPTLMLTPKLVTISSTG